MVVDFTLEKVESVVDDLLSFIAGRKLIAFHGEMGAGKTTFISALCKALNAEDAVSSPTFSIINEYASPEGPIYHLDLYRIKDVREAINAGIEECINSGEYCFIEWPEIISPLLPADTVHCYISQSAAFARKLRINL